MAGRDQVYVVAAPFLEGEHHGRQLLTADRAALTKLADGVVLAEDAAKMTVGEEYRPGAVPAYQGRLLTRVRSVAGDDNPVRDVALAAFPGEAVNAALAWAQ